MPHMLKRGGMQMNRNIRQRVTVQLGEAAQQKSCFAPISRADRSALHQALEEEVAVCPAPGIYALRENWIDLKPPTRIRWMVKALSQLHPDWVFAGPTAALLHGLNVPYSQLTRIWLATSRSSHRTGGHPYSTIVVTGDEYTTCDGIRTTSLFRTVYDALRLTDFRSGLTIADSALRFLALRQDPAFASALHLPYVDPTPLVQGVSGSGVRLRDIKRIRAICALADARSESGGESIARATMLELGFAPPDLQREMISVIDGHSHYWVDFSWDLSDKQFVVGELDGTEKYVNVEMTHGKSVAQILEDEHVRSSHITADPRVTSFVRFSFSTVLKLSSFCRLLEGSGVPRTGEVDDSVAAAGGVLRLRA